MDWHHHKGEMTMPRKRRGRGEGAVYQRADGYWTGSISLGADGRGKRRRRTVYGKTKDEAQKKLRKLQTKADAGQLTEVNRTTLGEYLDFWLESRKAAIAAHTHLPYKRSCDKYLKPHLGGVQLA